MRQAPKAASLADDWGTVIPFSGYEMELPQLWERYGNEWVEYPHKNNDVYAMMMMYAVQRDEMPADLAPDGFAIFTTGWGAPLPKGQDEPSDDWRPSESAERERVALGVFVARDGSQVSEIRFESAAKPDPMRENYASGELAKAVDRCAYILYGVEFIARLVLILTDQENNLEDTDRHNLRDRVSLLIEAHQMMSDTEEGEGEL